MYLLGDLDLSSADDTAFVLRFFEGLIGDLAAALDVLGVALGVALGDFLRFRPRILVAMEVESSSESSSVSLSEFLRRKSKTTKHTQ